MEVDDMFLAAAPESRLPDTEKPSGGLSKTTDAPDLVAVGNSNIFNGKFITNPGPLRTWSLSQLPSHCSKFLFECPFHFLPIKDPNRSQPTLRALLPCIRCDLV